MLILVSSCVSTETITNCFRSCYLKKILFELVTMRSTSTNSIWNQAALNMANLIASNSFFYDFVCLLKISFHNSILKCAMGSSIAHRLYHTWMQMRSSIAHWFPIWIYESRTDGQSYRSWIQLIVTCSRTEY